MMEQTSSSIRGRVWTIGVLLVLACCGQVRAQNIAPVEVSSDNEHRIIDERPAYQNPALSITDRVNDLLARMTTEEKIGQLLVPEGWKLYHQSDGRVTLNENAVDDVILKQKAGSLYGVFRADPWTQITLATGLTPVQSATVANALQKFAIEKSRLHIPLLLVEECPHGHMAIGGTVFPTGLDQASTFDPALIKRMARAIGGETRATGGTICYGPVVDVARDLRWSRIEEGYGEDPFLASSMTYSAVQGLQSSSLGNPDAVVATLEHFVGAGDPEGGHNLGPIHVGIREMNQVILPPFRAGIAAGARSVTTSYNAIDGVPNTANHWLLTDLLRKEWGFQGFVVSDLGGIERLMYADHVADTLAQAAALALNAGLDVDLGGQAFPSLANAMKNGSVSEQTLDRATGRILATKFALGLFERPYVDIEKAKQVVDSEAHRKLALDVARESVILLKNADHALPLSKDLKSIAIIGPNADNVYNQLGDYTAPQIEGHTVTVLQGVREVLGPSANVRYARGCGIRDMSTAGFEEAFDAVRTSEVAVVVLGGSSARDFNTRFDASGAAKPSLSADGSEMESGEGYDRATLNLPGVQEELLERIVALGKPVILVLIEGRPLSVNWAADHVPAILDAFYPGEEGGKAIASILYGEYNPAGRLPVSLPRSVGQLPIFYGDQRPDYVDLASAPMFPFGYGLSYTTFAYDHLVVTADITNTGKRSGDEVVQLYLHEQVASIDRPAELLRGFERLHLDAGAKQTVHFHLTPNDLAVFNQNSKWIVEAGTFSVLVGASSADIRQRGQFSIFHTQLIDASRSQNDDGLQGGLTTAR
jgi:beta-glucosidase